MGPDRVRFSGPRGEVVLTRLRAAFPTTTTTLRFTSDGGTGVTITIRDGSGWLTRAAAASALASYPPGGDEEVKAFDLPSSPTTLHVEWLASGGCQPAYELVIEPGVRRVVVLQLTPPGGDAVGGECRVRLDFSRSVPAASVAGLLLYPV